MNARLLGPFLLSTLLTFDHAVASATPRTLALHANEVMAVATQSNRAMTPDHFHPLLDGSTLVAFEDNRLFAFAAGEFPDPSAGTNNTSGRRRILLLKPATFVIDDHWHSPSQNAPRTWQLNADQEPILNGNRVRIPLSDRHLVCETLLPQRAPKVTSSTAKNHTVPSKYAYQVTASGHAKSLRFVHVLHLQSANRQNDPAPAQLTESSSQSIAEVRLAAGSFRWFLPEQALDSGHLEMADPRGVVRLERRLLPAGILPHGPKGRRLLQRWDSAYQRGRAAPWDTGRPSSELVRLVESNRVKPGRTLELGSGSGFNAIYLAQKQFAVTALDIAPTALLLAEERARQSGLNIHWILADVLAPPHMRPFDFIFDRGCYHGVRSQNAADYVAALRQLSQPGTQILILAGNANEPPPHYGPPRVTEEQIRSDFKADFKLEQLRDIRFDTPNPTEGGALAWSILLRRKSPAEPNP